MSNEDTRDDATVMADENDAGLSKAQRIAAFRERSKKQNGNIRPRGGTWKAVHLLGMDEIASLFGDITAGLAFLVGLLSAGLDSSLLMLRYGHSTIELSCISILNRATSF